KPASTHHEIRSEAPFSRRPSQKIGPFKENTAQIPESKSCVPFPLFPVADERLLEQRFTEFNVRPDEAQGITH
ncbi:MAG: hypothetical protein AB7O38_14600, partial [Pirellulaceae bacterium]